MILSTVTTLLFGCPTSRQLYGFRWLPLQLWIVYQIHFTTLVFCQVTVYEDVPALPDPPATIPTNPNNVQSPSKQPSPQQTIYTTSNPLDIEEYSGEVDSDLYVQGTSENRTSTKVTTGSITEATAHLRATFSSGDEALQSTPVTASTYNTEDHGSGDIDRKILDNSTSGLSESDKNATTSITATIPQSGDLKTESLTVPISTSGPLLTDPSYVNVTRTTESIVTSGANVTKPGGDPSLTVTEDVMYVPDNVTVVGDILTAESNTSSDLNSTLSIGVTSPGIFVNATMATTTFSSLEATTGMNVNDSTMTSTEMTTILQETTFEKANVTETTSVFTSTPPTTPELNITSSISDVNITTSIQDQVEFSTTTGLPPSNDTTGSGAIPRTTTFHDTDATTSDFTLGYTEGDDNLTSSATTPYTPSGPGAELWIIVLASIAGILLVIIIIFIACCIKKKRGEKARKMRYVGDDDIMDYAYHPRRPDSPPTKQNGTTPRASAGMRASPPKMMTSQENPSVTLDDGVMPFDPTTKPAFRNYFQDGLDNLDSSNETLNNNDGSPTVPEMSAFNHNSIMRRDKNKDFPLHPLDPKKARMSMGPVMLNSNITEGAEAEEGGPSTQKTYDKIYTHSTFKK